MKTTTLLIVGLMISFSSFSQKHKNFTFVPRGSFSIQMAEAPISISVDNFWMSYEITNKEFRQFYNQIKSSPDDSISWIDLSDMKNSKTGKPKIISKAYGEIIDILMDESVWKSIFGKPDYFTNPKYNDFPVVGVTWEGANYYGYWRSKEENKKFKGQDLTLQMNYRLPTHIEWEYASTFNDSETIVGSKELHQVDKGEKNKLGLLNLNGNVSEWTSSAGSNDRSAYKVVKGSSWKSASKHAKSEFVLPDKATDYIGFRIVRSDINK